jgi:hypothetical protein
MTVGGLVDTVFRFNRPCECHLYTAPRNKNRRFMVSLSNHKPPISYDSRDGFSAISGPNLSTPRSDKIFQRSSIIIADTAISPITVNYAGAGATAHCPGPRMGKWIARD